MLQGVYAVRFASARGWQGRGLAYIHQGSVHGSDAGHYFLGILEESEADGFLARLRVLSHPGPDPAGHAARCREVHVLLHGRVDADMFHAVARVEGHPGLILDVFGVHEKMLEWGAGSFEAAYVAGMAMEVRDGSGAPART